MVQAMLDQTNFSLIQSQSKLEQEQKDMATLLKHFTENIEDLQDLNFSQDNNIFLKKIWSEEVIIVTQNLKQEIY